MLMLLASAVARADEADAARLDALQKQLQQVQAALQQLAEENRALRAHEREVDRKLAELGAPAGPAGAAAVAQAAPPPAPALPNSALPNVSALPAAGATPATAGTGAPAANVLSELGSGLRLWGYGELYYTDPVNDRSQTQFDLARAVFGIGYKFDERTEFNSEYEVEHAVSSADDVGEFEVEQFYVDRQLNEALSVRAGLFLMPFGFINEHHEPTNFYGMQRNFVETLIIPSTWREGGFNLHGDTAAGFGWNVGLTTGNNLADWDFAPEFPPYQSALQLENSGIAPLQATHQEAALASARYLSQYVALSYYGIPGFTLGAAISSGDAEPVPPPPGAPHPGTPRVTLWEGHARWQPGRWDLSALYAHGAISNTSSVNAANPGSPNPIPSAFYGYYFQGAYEAWRRDEYRLNPFVRWESYNMGSSYQGTSGPQIPGGEVPLGSPGEYGLWPVNHDRVWSVGANLYITPHVVLKSDYQWFEENTSFNRWDLGLGVAF